jgi:hypothetical protein
MRTIHRVGKLKPRETARFVAITEDNRHIFLELGPKGELVVPECHTIELFFRPPAPRRPLPVPILAPPETGESALKVPRPGYEFMGILNIDKLQRVGYSIRDLLNPAKPVVV